MLDPDERYTIEECLEHQAFQTERLLDKDRRVPVKVIDSHTSKKRKNDSNNHVTRCVGQYIKNVPIMAIQQMSQKKTL